jgi:2-aminoadipate transaminase
LAEPAADTLTILDTVIDDLHRVAARRAGTLSLAGGLPLSSLFPRDLLSRVGSEATRDPSGAALQYGWPEGNEGLRRWIAADLRRRGAQVNAEDVIITSGAQQALSLTVSVLPEVRRSIDVTAETYPGALDLFRRAGALVSDARCAGVSYVVTGVGNPSGVDITPAERNELLASGRFLVVDEAYAELRFDGHAGRPLCADAPDHVFHVGTFSKTLCPGLRVGWVIGPARFRQALIAAKRNADLQASTLGQDMLEKLFERFDWDDHLVRARKAYARRLDRLMHSVRRHLPSFSFREPEGGFTLFVRSDDPHLDEVEVLERATAFGTSFDPGSLFRRDESARLFAMRLSPCNVPETAIDHAVGRVAQALERPDKRARYRRRSRAARRATP